MPVPPQPQTPQPETPQEDRAFADRVTAQVGALLAGVTRLGVAFSGGVDSSVLLALAARCLGPGQVVAILGVSPSLAADERAAAHAVAEAIGVAVVEVSTHEGDRAAYRANGPDRCFHCKDELFTRIGADVVDAHRLDAVAYGENADDAGRPDRPGARAATRHRVLRPLADAGLDKAAVRRIARVLRLPCADKPAAPCLASRIPHFSNVSPEKLGQIDRAEAALRRLGFTDLRVRHHGEIARIELPVDDLVRAVTEPLRQAVHAAVTGAGFRFAAVDLAGVQSGAFTLPLVQVLRG
ncbi:MAG TPA: ATP-dependent sacrificial sulfur transferase LarE [Catenuloplanes sp.]